MTVSRTCHVPPRNVRRRASLLPTFLFFLLSLCLHACVADEQHQEDAEAALSDIDSFALTDNQSPLELAEFTMLKSQTEWRSDVSNEANDIFLAAVAAQIGIKEVTLLDQIFPVVLLFLAPSLFSLLSQASPSNEAAVAAFSLLSSAASLGHPGAQRELGLAFKYAPSIILSALLF